MMKNSCRIVGFLSLFLLLFTLQLPAASKLEDAYNKYVQGRYEDSLQDLKDILASNPTPKEAFELQQDLGLRAFLEMAQNQFLTKEIRRLSAIAWQYERHQFKNPRRIAFWLKNYLEDKSVRGPSLMNLVAAGEYAVPQIIDHLGQKEDDLFKRGLSYQALRRIGSESIPGLLAATYAEDPVLIVNIVRLLTEFRDNRALPYIARLLETRKEPVIQAELQRSLPFFPDISQTNSSILMIAEANRYTREDQAAIVESLSSDGLLWEWNPEEKMVVALNVLGQNFEFKPNLPPSLWPLFRSELILYEVYKHGMAQNETLYARAALLCSWVAQEQRVKSFKSKDDNYASAKLEKLAEHLEYFYKRRMLQVEVGHWAGTDTLLLAIDMASKQMEPIITARLLQLATDYHADDLIDRQIVSFIDGQPTNPIIQCLHHSNELVRYWAAITAGRAKGSLQHDSQSVIIDLLTQATDEVYVPSVLVVAEATSQSDALVKILQDNDINVYKEDTGYDGLNALREFPSKDIIIVATGLTKNLSTVEFVSRVRQDFKGKDVPLAVFCSDAEKPDVTALYQDHAQQIILHGESDAVVMDKIEALKAKADQIVAFRSQEANVKQVSLESLKSLKNIDPNVLRSYPVIVNHLNDLISHKFHERAHQILAIQVLKSYGDLAHSSTSVLLDKVFSSETDNEYKLEVLSTMRHTSRAHPKARELLFKMVHDESVDRLLRRRAASYLGLDYHQASEEERRTHQWDFFTPEYIKHRESE